MWKEYLFPKTLLSAVNILQKKEGQAKVIAGGTDILIQLKYGNLKTDCLVDITRIPGLDQIYTHDEKVIIGGTATHAKVAGSKIIQRNGSLLSKACQAVGSPQIRNVATVAGNIVSAQPAADAAVALIALDSEISLYGYEKPISIANLYKAQGVSHVNSALDIIQTISFNKIDKYQGTSFHRLSKRNALTLPIVSVAVFIALDLSDQTITQVRIVIAPVAHVPLRMEKAEHSLIGTKISIDTIQESALLASESLVFRDSTFRGSADYRKRMARVLVERALLQAIEEAKLNI